MADYNCKTTSHDYFKYSPFLLEYNSAMRLAELLIYLADSFYFNPFGIK
jgi:hypothetical protein